MLVLPAVVLLFFVIIVYDGRIGNGKYTILEVATALLLIIPPTTL